MTVIQNQWSLLSRRQVHLAHLHTGRVESISIGRVDRLLALHSSEHHCVVRLQSSDVVLLLLEGRLRVADRLDTLAQAILSHQGNDLAGMLLLGVNPTRDLVDGKSIQVGTQLSDLHHSLLNRGDGLLDISNKLGVVKDSTRNLAMATTETKNKVQSGFLLDVVVRQRAAILELLASEDQTLLVRWDAFLVLNLGLDVVYGIRGLHIECDRLSRERLHKNLHGSKADSESH